MTSTTTTTIISGGPTRFDQRGVTLRRASHIGQARNTLSSFLFRVLPIPASRPMPSGHFMCMAFPPTEGTRSDGEHHWSVVNTKEMYTKLGRNTNEINQKTATTLSRTAHNKRSMEKRNPKSERHARWEAHFRSS